MTINKRLQKKVVRPDSHVRSDRPYAPGVIYNGVIYCSGATGSNPSTKEIDEGGIKPQARRVFRNLELIAREGGASLDSALKLTIFLTDIENDFEPMNEVFREFFPSDPPARSTVEVAALARPGLLIEAEMIAAVIDAEN